MHVIANVSSIVNTTESARGMKGGSWDRTREEGREREKERKGEKREEKREEKGREESG